MKTVKLYRPVGLKELELIMNADWKKFPPRLEWQPIFYPVLNQPYAAQIAREWNTRDECSGYCGIVTEFDLLENHYLTFTVQNVGGTIHNELWVPAAELEEFNENIAADIRIVEAFFGDSFELPPDAKLWEALLKFRNNG
jgi:hypothetical protein